MILKINRAMYGKCMTHLIGLSEMINAINKATILISNAPDVDSQAITNEFIEYCRINLIEKTDNLSEFSKINIDSVEYGEILLR